MAPPTNIYHKLALQVYFPVFIDNHLILSMTLMQLEYGLSLI